jgi:hypothetical protein
MRLNAFKVLVVRLNIKTVMSVLISIVNGTCIHSIELRITLRR